MNIDKELKRIAQEKKELQKQRQQLLEQKRKRKAALSKLGMLVKQSGFSTPKALAEALIERYNIRHRRELGISPTKRRKRTKMTAELRDQIRAMLKDRSGVCDFMVYCSLTVTYSFLKSWLETASFTSVEHVGGMDEPSSAASH